MSERLRLRSDRVLRVVTHSPARGEQPHIKKSLGVAAVLLVLAIVGVAWATTRATTRPHGERKERSTGRNFATQTDVQSHPRASNAATGWDSERVWSGQDDWEPFVAADRTSNYVYQMTTRFNARLSGIFIRRSADGGQTWDADQLVRRVQVWQADPQVQVDANGTVFVVWLSGPNWKSTLIKSYDHGATWTEPVEIAPSLQWTDHPWLVVSPDGQDVYVGLNMNGSYLVSSHDGGQTFGTPIKTNRSMPGHWWDANGAAIAPDGSVYFLVINFFLNYRGPAEITVVSSHDKGASWQTTLVDTSAPPPGCFGAAGCGYGFFSSTGGVAVDQAGQIMVTYHAGDVEKQPQPMWSTTSTDGINWTPRMQISEPNEENTNGFPAIATGPTAGDFRVVWQGTTEGNNRAWNTFYRRTTDGGATWGEIVRLSDRADGAPYKSAAGYTFPYGDYIGLSVDGAGINHVIWGEGASYNGPGGVWYTRGL